MTAIWGCFYSSEQRRDGKVHLDGGVEEAERKEGASQMQMVQNTPQEPAEFPI